MALATNSTPGSIVLAGDLTGTATDPQLRVTGVDAGYYSHATIVTDAKGRLIYAKDGLQFYGDVTGPIILSSLATTGVTAGTYTNATIAVDSKGRVTNAASGPSFVGDVNGPVGALTLAVIPGVAGSYTNANITVDAKGRVTAVSSPTIGGDFSGTTVANMTLKSTGVSAGSYTHASITVDARGLITDISTTNYAVASTTELGYVQIASNTGLAISAGVLSGNSSTNSTVGVVKSANSSNITITAGAIDVGVNIPNTGAVNTFQKFVGSSFISTNSNLVPDLAAADLFFVDATSSPTHGYPINATDGQQFDIVATNVGTQTATTPTFPSGDWTAMAWNGTTYVVVGGDTSAQSTCYSSSDGTTWTARTLPSGFWLDIIWNGSLFIAVGSKCATSPDGITWTERTIPTSGGKFYTIKWNELTGASCNLISFGLDSGGVNYIQANSTDGITWTSDTTLPTILNNTGLILASGHSAFTVTGNTFYCLPIGALFYTSVDGVSWTTVFKSTNIGGYAAASNGGNLLVAVQYNVNGAAYIAYSENRGSTWNTFTLATPANSGLRSFFWCKNVFFLSFTSAVTPTYGYYTSSDLKSWLFHSTGVNGYRVGFGGPTSDAFLVYGTNGVRVKITTFYPQGNYLISNHQIVGGSSVILKCFVRNSTVYGTYLR